MNSILDFDILPLTMRLYVYKAVGKELASCDSLHSVYFYIHIPVITAAPVPFGTIIPTATSTSLTPRPVHLQRQQVS